MNILFVCLGNICRSPMARGILKAKFEEGGIGGITDSCGVMDWNVGSRADDRAIGVCREFGVDISSHRARQIRPDDFQRFQLIVVMDRSNEKAVKKLAPVNSGAIVIRAGQLDSELRISDIESGIDKNQTRNPNLVNPGDMEEYSIRDIEDPYHGNVEDFREVYKRLDKLLEQFLGS